MQLELINISIRVPDEKHVPQNKHAQPECGLSYHQCEAVLLQDAVSLHKPSPFHRRQLRQLGAQPVNHHSLGRVNATRH